MSIHSRSARARLLTVTVPTCAALLAGFGTVSLVGSAGAQDAADLKPQPPDLTQDLPRDISVVPERQKGRQLYRLAFRSAAENHPDFSVGGGTLAMVGRRVGASKTMTMDQYVDVFDPVTGRLTQEVHRNVGAARYVDAGTHEHWHVVGFERFELRSVSNNRLVAPDRKTGFCVGNRYDALRNAETPATRSGGAVRRGVDSRAPRVTYKEFNGDCAQNKPAARKIIVGINPETGDDYKAFVEGQYIDITRVPSGRYVLVHRVNPTRKIVEADYSNNNSSVLLEIKRSGAGKPTVRTLAKCMGKARCAAGPKP